MEYQMSLAAMQEYGACCTTLSALKWNEASPERTHIMDLVQQGVDRMHSTTFEIFDNDPDLRGDKLRDFYFHDPILEYYDRAFDKLLFEVPTTQVPEGSVILWHLYNMGYVVKTHTQCFGIDLHHRRAALLAPYLDFLMISHNHSDHINSLLLNRMSGKTVISNFYPAKGYCRGRETFEFGDVTVETEETDHNNTLRNFMQPHLIRCGKGPDSCVIYHVGDSCTHEQLNPNAEKIDFFIVHPRVGLSTIDAVKKLRPAWTLLSHTQEMGHCQPCIWRAVNFKELETDTAQIEAEGLHAMTPLWGEKIIWSK